MLAEERSVERLTMKMLGECLGVNVSSICYHFHRRDDLLAAMAKHLLRTCAFPSLEVIGSQWRQSLWQYAVDARKVFLANPIVADLVLIRGEPTAMYHLDTEHVQRAITALVSAGLAPEHAARTLSAVANLVHGSVVLARLSDVERRRDTAAFRRGYFTTPVNQGHPGGAEVTTHSCGSVSDERTFKYGLTCILGRCTD